MSIEAQQLIGGILIATAFLLMAAIVAFVWWNGRVGK